MDIDDKLSNAMQNIDKTLTELKLNLGIMSTKQDEFIKKLDRGTHVMDSLAVRIRNLEFKQGQHIAYFMVLGTGLGIVSSFLFTLYDK